MQPIVAESVPHRGRGFVLAAVVVVAASLFLLMGRPCATRHRSHDGYRQSAKINLMKQQVKQLKRIGKCAHPRHLFDEHYPSITDAR